MLTHVLHLGTSDERNGAVAHFKSLGGPGTNALEDARADAQLLGYLENAVLAGS